MTWNGLGINYSYNTYDLNLIEQDLQALIDVGINKIRPSLPAYDDATGITRYQAIASLAKSMGMYVTWGLTLSSSVALSPGTNWNAYRDTVLAKAEECYLNNVCDEFEAGNELYYNSSGKGMGANGYDLDTYHTELLGLATLIKAVFPLSVTYVAIQGTGIINKWIADIGDFDRVGFNIYGATLGGEDTFEGYIDQIVAGMTPDKFWISEWSIHPTYMAIQSSIKNGKEKGYAREIRRRQQYLQDSGVTNAYYFMYRTAGDHPCVVKLADDTYRLAWNPLATNNGRDFFVNR